MSASLSRLSSFCVFRVILPALLSISPALQAQTVSWTKTIDFDINTGYAYTGHAAGDPRGVNYINAPTTGISTGPSVSGVSLGKTGTSADTQPTPADGNAFYGFFNTTDQYVTLTLTFDTLLTGGTLANVGSLQWHDYKVELSGGDATLANLDVTMTTPSGYNPLPGPGDWSITGDGTPALTLLNNHPEQGGWGFNGAQGFQITGTWTTVKLTHFSHAPSSFGESYDDVAGFTVNGATVSPNNAPEPAAALLLGLTAACSAATRRRRFSV
jgi:hypothetical protein